MELNQDITITMAETDNDLLEIVPLKAADDSECVNQKIPDCTALDDILRTKEDGCDLWIVRLRGRGIGYAIGEVKDNNYRSHAIYVSPDFRNNGIGLELKQIQIAFARQLGCKEIYSHVDAANYASIRVQVKAGFRFEPNGDGYIVRLSLQD